MRLHHLDGADQAATDSTHDSALGNSAPERRTCGQFEAQGGHGIEADAAGNRTQDGTDYNGLEDAADATTPLEANRSGLDGR